MREDRRTEQNGERGQQPQQEGFEPDRTGLTRNRFHEELQEIVLIRFEDDLLMVVLIPSE